MSDAPVSPAPPSIGFRKIIRGASWNWGEFVLTGALGFFVAPFVVHHLGSTSYGVWILINSMVSYMGLLDLGMRGAVVRFVSADQPLGLHVEASQAVSAALWFRLWLGGIVLVASVGLALISAKTFNIPPELHAATRFAILLSGTNLALSLTVGIFSGVLNALHRFDLISAATIGQAALNAAGIVFLLDHGHGIVAIALWQLTVGVLVGIFLYRSARRVYPELKFLLGPPGRELMKKFWSYSAFLSLAAMAGQIIYYTDNVVIGAALPITAVTLYALGFAPTQYLRQIVSSLTVTLLPAASNLAAQGHYDQLRRLLIQGTRAVMLIALSIESGLFFRGKTFISLWMGAQYGEVSGNVLRVLMLSWFFIAGSGCAANVLFGLSKHKQVALWSVVEAIANLGLSIFLVLRLGVIGVAWGTTLPSLFINVFIWPRYITRILEIPLPRYLYNIWIQPAMAVAPFAVGCFLAERWWPAGNLLGFFLQMAALLPLVLGGTLLVFRREVGDVLRSKNLMRIVPERSA